MAPSGIFTDTDGTQWPGVAAVVMFHGQNLYYNTNTGDYRVFGQNSQNEGNNMRTQIMQCESATEVWYPGWVTPQNEWDGMQYLLSEFGVVLRSNNIMTATTFNGLWNGQAYAWQAGERERASLVPGGGRWVPSSSLPGGPQGTGDDEQNDDGVI